ncbi:MAG TPA: hypothetical protein VMB03_27575 [Bryobacteraceae bacterium]|nr:hypothetical protein [Bryobacteraceae bacterium]
MSKSSVLIIATNYDAGSHYTFQWASDLQAELATMDHTSILLDAGALCRAGTTLADAVASADYVVFFGHGFADELTALPAGSGGKTVPLVNGSNMGVLAGRKVFAGCCHSLAKLGRTYAKQFSAEYVGYDNVFAFETANHHYFRDIVNNAVVDFVKGASGQTVAANLQKAWAGLRDAFAGGGILQYRPNAFAAAQYAEDNRKRIGYAP